MFRYPFDFFKWYLIPFTEADDYCSNVHPMAGRRVLLVSRVVVGNALEKRKNTKDFTHTPYPYHSVCIIVDMLIPSTHDS